MTTPLAQLTDLAELLETKLQALDAMLTIDAPFFVESAEAMRRADMLLDIRAARLADVARRYRHMLDDLRATLDDLERLRQAGTLDATVRLGVASLADPDADTNPDGLDGDT